MAITVDFDGQILTGAESDADGGTWDLYGTKNSPTDEDGFVFQDQQSISDKVSSGTGGIEFIASGAVDHRAIHYIILAKMMIATPGAIDLTVAEGVSYQIGYGTNPDDMYHYFIAGLYAGAYPLMRSWLILAIDPSEVAFRDAVTGTPDLSISDYYALWADMAASAKVENVVHDRLDYLAPGEGLTLYGTTPDATFLDFLIDDFGTQANRFGVITPGEAELVVNGWLNIGDAANAAVFNDLNQIIIFPHQRVGEGFFGMKYDLTQASTDIDINSTTFKSLGHASTKLFFDTSLEVDGLGTPDTVTIVGHGLSTGDYVLYSKEGGSHDMGLTDSEYYFVRAVDADSLAFYEVGATVGRQNSFTETDSVALTTVGAPGENHSIIRAPDTRADHTAVDVGGELDLGSCSIDGARVVTLTSACTISGGFLLRAGNVIATTASIGSLNITCNTLTEGDALFDPLVTLSNITNCSIVAGTEGHFARLTVAGGTSAGNSYTGFWAPASGGWNFHTQTGVDPGVDEQITTDAAHDFTTGDAVYYNDEGGSDDIGLVDGSKYYVGVIDSVNVSLHETRAAAVAGTSKIDLTAGVSGETHSLYSAKAAVFNDTGGPITITVSGGDNPSFRNGTGASTTIAVSKNVDVHVKNAADADLLDATVSIFRATKTAYTSAAGNAEGYPTFVVNKEVDSDQAQQGWINIWRKSDNAHVSIRYASWDLGTLTLLSEITGTADTGGSGTVLKRKTGTSFLSADIEVGDAVRNTTDGSWSKVDQIIDADTIYTRSLRDGTLDTWTEDDAYSFHRLPITFVETDDLVDLPLFLGQTDASGDMPTYSHNYSGGPLNIRVNVRHRDDATKYLPEKASGTIGVSGYTLDVTMEEDTDS